MKTACEKYHTSHVLAQFRPTNGGMPEDVLKPLTFQPKILMVHVVFVIETRPFLPYRAHVLANVGDNLVRDQKPNTQNEFHLSKHMFHFGLFRYFYLELLVGEASTRAAGALDPGGGRSLGVTHFQERGEHAPPENTIGQHTTTLHIILHNHAISRYTGQYFTRWHSSALMLGWSHFQLSWFCSTKTIVCLMSEEFKLGHALFEHNWENIYTK